MSLALTHRMNQLEDLVRGFAQPRSESMDLSAQVDELRERVHKLEGELRAMKARMGKAAKEAT